MDPSYRGDLVNDVQHNRPYGLGDQAMAGDQNKPALHKRIKHKFTHDEPEVAAYKNEPPQAPHVATHDRSQDYAIAVGHAVLAQAMLELSEPRNVAVLSALTTEITGQIGRQLVAEPGRRGLRTILNEAVAGGYDAVERKGWEWFEALEGPMLLVVLGAGAFVATFALGIFMAVWRFVLLGV